MPQVMQVIESHDRRGLGTSENDPIRLVVQYYTLDGELLAEHDPCKNLKAIDLINQIIHWNSLEVGAIDSMKKRACEALALLQRQ